MGHRLLVAAALVPAVLATTVLVTSISCGGAKSSSSRPDCEGGKIWHRDDAARFRNCEHITGSLHLGGALEGATDFAKLASIEGDLIVGPSYQLTNLSSLSSVVRIGGRLHVEGNWRLQGLFLGALQSVAGAIEVRDNTGLKNCALHSLRTFGALHIQGNRNLERVDLTGLEAEGPQGFVEGPALQEVLAPDRIRQRENPSPETRAKGS
jgi:hypothetical protein